MNELLGIIFPVLMLVLFAAALVAPYLILGGVMLGGSKIWHLTVQRSRSQRVSIVGLYFVAVAFIYLDVGWLLAANTIERGSGVDENIFVLVWPFTLITYVW